MQKFNLKLILNVTIIAAFFISGCTQSSSRSKSNPQLEKKVEFYSMLLEIVPNSKKGDYYSKLTEVYKELGEKEKAREYQAKFEKEVETNYSGNEIIPGYTPDYFKKIIQICDDFIANNPDAAYAYLEEASSYMSLQNPDKAFEAVNKAIDIDSENADAYILRSAMYRRIDQREKAQIDEQKAIKLEMQRLDKR
ncbi:MAG: hypothetical protein B1H08_01380 [Candidatus Omnitrophica bacterium 4484_171]|nr:MAG: hypothetical protein B1H08_01380 [Candidatus Omnitrophica bacterium 4484_171]